jgi:hypothetical protein
VTTGERVRRLPKILESAEAARLLEVVGFDAAEEYLRREHPEEQELYALLEKARSRLAAMTLTELGQLKNSTERMTIVRALQGAIDDVLGTVGHLRRDGQP